MARARQLSYKDRGTCICSSEEWFGELVHRMLRFSPSAQSFDCASICLAESSWGSVIGVESRLVGAQNLSSVDYFLAFHAK